MDSLKRLLPALSEKGKIKFDSPASGSRTYRDLELGLVSAAVSSDTLYIPIQLLIEDRGISDADLILSAKDQQLLGTERIGEDECYVIEALTVDLSTLITVKLWVSKDKYLIRKVVERAKTKSTGEYIITEETYNNITLRKPIPATP